MMKYILAVGDVHGEYDLLTDVLSNYDKNYHQLVFIGDLIDRGPNAKQALLTARHLVEEDGAIYLKGNHEEMLLNFLNAPEDYYEQYLRNGGGETITSLLHAGALEEYSATEIAMKLRFYYPDLWPFLAELPLYYEWNSYVFVHAGVDLSLTDWRETTPHDFLWIRQAFHTTPSPFAKTFVFGHTITPSLHGDNQTTDLWIQKGKIGIDGGAVYGGSLHGVIFSANGLVQDCEYQKISAPWQPSF